MTLLDLPVSAQRYFTRIYTEADGLSSNMVYDVTQDTLGLMWFATRNGVCSYNGNQWITYAVDPALKVFSFTHIISDQKGTLWTVPQQGDPVIYRFWEDHWETYALDTIHKTRGYFTAVDITYQDDEPVFALGTNSKGLFLFKDNSWVHLTSQDGLISNQIRGLLFHQESLYIATDKGISVLSEPGISNHLTSLLPHNGREVLALGIQYKDQTISKSNPLWLFGDEWVGQIVDGEFKKVLKGFPVSAYDINSRSFLVITPEDNFYFGNPFYLYFWDPLNPEQIEQIGRDNGLITDGATAVYIDRELNTWITGYRGITKIPSRRFSFFTKNEGLYDNEVSSALEISPGKYLFGHHGALTFFDGKRFTSRSLLKDSGKDLPEARVQDMAMDQDGNVWIAASTLGIARMTPAGKIIWYEPVPDANFSSIVSLPNGRIYACADKLLMQLDKKTNTFFELEVPKNINFGFRKLFFSNDSVLICATYSNGLYIRNGKQDILIKSAQDEFANNVYAYYQDSSGNQWVGSVIGLYKIHEDHLVKVDTMGLRIDRPIYLILEDSLRRLWFGTDNGIFRWDGKKLDHFTRTDGISGQEINRDAGLLDSKGVIWFGTNYGITKYNPEYGYRKKSIPKPIIKLEWLEVNGDTLNPDENQSLPSTSNNITFAFSDISFINEAAIEYVCKLEGFDTDWSPPFVSEKGNYRYNNLLPGNYRFCVKAKNALGIWSDPVCSYKIRIRAPFYFQSWFVILASIVVIFLLVFGFRLIVTRRYNERLERMVAIKTRELRQSEKALQDSNASKDSFFSIIAHDLKSPFNAIVGMLEILTTEYDDFTDLERQRILVNLRNSSTRTINLLENLLTWAQAQKGILPFEPEKFDLMELITENVFLFESAAKSKWITLNKPMADVLYVYADRNMINTVIRNLLSNAIKFTFEGGSVTISVTRKAENYEISMTDTGIGMNAPTLENLFRLEKSQSTRGTNNESGTGLGLILSKDFVEKNGGKIWVISVPEKGTTFSFTIPLSPPPAN